MLHLQAIASHLPDTPMMVYGTGRWAHFNVKLHFLPFDLDLYSLPSHCEGQNSRQKSRSKVKRFSHESADRCYQI